MAKLSVGQVLYGRLSKAIADNTTLSDVEAMNHIIEFTGTLSAGKTITFPANDGYTHMLYNNTGQTLTMKVSGQTGFTVATGKRCSCYCDGTDMRKTSADV